jgi:putative transposase
VRAADLQGRHPKAWKRTTTGARDPVAAPDLVARKPTAEHPDEKWCGDITYVKTWDGWAYLATVIDLHSRKIVGWAVADHMRTDLVTAALDMAVTTRNPPPGVIFHSDRGAQYTSRAFDEYCRHNNIRRSLGRTGTCYDNAVSESFFATYKKELVHTRPWPTVTDLVDHTHDWIQNYYNSIRRHPALNYLTPQEYELGLRSLNQIAA